jgi:hypothetical protein
LSNTLKIALISLIVSVTAGGCNPDQTVSDLNFDSAHTLAYDGTIDQGKILTNSDDEYTVKSQVREQLMYTIGQLNGRNGGIDMRKLEVSIIESVPRPDNGGYDVTYAAKLFIAWPREYSAPENYELVLPARGDYAGLDRFFDAYGSDENGDKKCLAWEAHDVSQGIFWYYYRPEKAGCGLRDPSADDAELVTRLNVRLEVSRQNTENKYPEYEKVWEDSILVTTSIFGKNEDGATSSSDAGIAAFRRLYNDLIRTYGAPVSSNLPAGQQPSNQNDDIRLVFETQYGKLDAHLYLVDGIRSVDADFRAKYNERTKKSDFVSYSGHSGLGANIRALARMGSFEPGQYQIFLINGCDTFAYVDGALTDAHHTVNPDFAPTKFVDMITNAMPSYFHSNSRSNMQVIDALLKKEKTYRDILAGFDRAQRANVTGEEDNRWPLTFIEQ